MSVGGASWNELCAAIDVQIDALAQVGDIPDATVLRLLASAVESTEALDVALDLAVSSRWSEAVRCLMERIWAISGSGTPD